jgi:copper chaperone
MKEVTLSLSELACPDCANKIGQILERQKGVEKASVSFATSKVKVAFNPDVISLDQIEKAIERTGYKVIKK